MSIFDYYIQIETCLTTDSPIETTISALQEMVDEGLISGISLSEVGAATIRRAAAVATISVVEIEFSMSCTDALENGVLTTCAELNIPVAPYSPLGRGLLSGKIRSVNDIAKGDFVAHLDQFSAENLPENVKLADAVKEIADKLDMTPAQLALAWIMKHEERFPGLTLIPIPGATTVERVVENLSEVKFLPDEYFESLNKIIKSKQIKGVRYSAGAEALLWA